MTPGKNIEGFRVRQIAMSSIWVLLCLGIRIGFLHFLYFPICRDCPSEGQTSHLDLPSRLRYTPEIPRFIILKTKHITWQTRRKI